MRSDLGAFDVASGWLRVTIERDGKAGSWLLDRTCTDDEIMAVFRDALAAYRRAFPVGSAPTSERVVPPPSRKRGRSANRATPSPR